jgi:hypothetical protein
MMKKSKIWFDKKLFKKKLKHTKLAIGPVVTIAAPALILVTVFYTVSFVCEIARMQFVLT